MAPSLRLSHPGRREPPPIDPNFSNAIKHIERPKEATADIASQMESDRTTLSETARRFVSLYLRTENEDQPEFES
jgi:hypothetical protein